ncbi:MAG: response regulator [Terracidiphilus sp.]
MGEKILFVDDEQAILDGYKRSLHKYFQPDTATSGQEALASIKRDGPYAVVVSDMRMPGMDGVKLLSEVSVIAPDTVRVILTGYADFQSAMDAVNDGKVFRFLTKPCDGELLRRTLADCIEQNRLITSEKELLEKTLIGCVRALADILSLANPAAFSRAVRIRKYVLQLVAELNLESGWKYEIAALLSQLGCVTLPSDVIDAAFHGEHLTSEQQDAFDKHPGVTRDLLSKIPRVQDIGWVVAQQRLAIGSYDSEVNEKQMVGADILRLAIAFDDLKIKNVGDVDARARLKYISRASPNLIRGLAGLRGDVCSTELRALRISDLAAGMILQEDVWTSSGLLVVVRGHEITLPLIARLNNFQQQRAIPDKVLVLCPSIEDVFA